MKATDLLQRCLDEIDCDVYSDPVTLELVQDIKDYLKAQQDLLVGRVVSSGHGITVTAYSIPESVSNALNTKKTKLPFKPWK